MRLRSMLAGLAMGSGIQYLLDRQEGRKRRARLHDASVHTERELKQGSQALLHDAKNRTAGLFARTWSRFRRRPVADEVLEARIRSSLGRALSHPHSTFVSVQNGRATISGLILKHELGPALEKAAQVPGVHEVVNRLEVYRGADGIPSLQGGRRRKPSQASWSPTARLLGTILGAIPSIYGMRHRGFMRFLPLLTGSPVLIRSILNLPFSRLFGLGSRRRVHRVHKTFHIQAHPEKVYEVIAEQCGLPLTEHSTVTRSTPAKLYVWRSGDGGGVSHSGKIVFSESQPGTTRLDIDVSYATPLGEVGRASARLFGRDLKKQLDEQLMRMKSLIEQGPSRRGLRVVAGS